MAISDFAVVCTLTPETLEIRREGLLARLVARTTHRRDLPGHRLRFATSGDLLGQIARTVDAERRCCQVLRFQITVEPDGGPIQLDLAGPLGTREFVAALLDRA